jgi:glycosyltransferase involved in cell wall biosynthesis
MRVVLIGFFATDYVISLANALAKVCELTLFLKAQNVSSSFPKSTSPESALFEEKVLAPTVSLRLVDYPLGRYFSKMEMVRSLAREIVTLQPDLIHYQWAGDPWGPLLLFSLRKYPRVVTIHDVTRHPGDGKSDLVHYLAVYLASHLAHQAIVHGRQQAQLLCDRYKCAPVRINSILLGPMYSLPVPQPVESDDLTVLFFGRLRYYKGIEVLIRAAPLIKSEVPGAKFLIAGSG